MKKISVAINKNCLCQQSNKNSAMLPVTLNIIKHVYHGCQTLWPLSGQPLNFLLLTTNEAAPSVSKNSLDSMVHCYMY